MSEVYVRIVRTCFIGFLVWFAFCYGSDTYMAYRVIVEIGTVEIVTVEIVTVVICN